MKPIYFTIAGTNHYYGSDFMKPDMTVYLEKDKDNTHDKEAIAVKMAGLDTVGYVANSPYTVLGESYSAGRLYDRIKKNATGRIVYVLPQGILCRLDEKSLPSH